MYIYAVMNKYYASWQHIQDSCKSIYDQLVQEKKHYDYVVGVLRGGAVPATILSHMLNCKLHVIGIKTYEDTIQTNRAEFYAIDSNFYANCFYKRLLIVDDICDSGNSLKLLQEFFHERTHVVVDSATVYWKPSSIVKPDYYAHEAHQWIVFPWEQEKDEKSLENS